MSHVVLVCLQSVLQHPSGIHLPFNPPDILHSVLMHLDVGFYARAALLRSAWFTFAKGNETLGQTQWQMGSAASLLCR